MCLTVALLLLSFPDADGVIVQIGVAGDYSKDVPQEDDCMLCVIM